MRVVRRDAQFRHRGIRIHRMGRANPIYVSGIGQVGVLSAGIRNRPFLAGRLTNDVTITSVSGNRASPKVATDASLPRPNSRSFAAEWCGHTADRQISRQSGVRDAGATNAGKILQTMLQTMLQRPFTPGGPMVSALGLGGHHLGDAEDQKTAEQIVHTAIDEGVTFFDNCWEYHRGKSEVWLGSALKGRRQGVFLMTKVCTHGRDRALAIRMLEQSLRRLQTDHLDLWQIHGVSFDNDPDLFIRPNGAAEALEQARREGKVRYVGFTGHKSPAMHLGMLKTGFHFDAVQMPINPFDASFNSFQKQVVPEATQKGMAVLGMKPFSGTADPVKKGILTPEETLRYAMSVPGITVTITGVDKPEILRQNLDIASKFKPMTQDEMRSLVDRIRAAASDGRFELYKLSLKYDNPEAHLAHEFPIDTAQKEVLEMLHSTDNSGHPFAKPESP